MRVLRALLGLSAEDGPFHVVPAPDADRRGRPIYRGYHVMHGTCWHSTHRWRWQANRTARSLNAAAAQSTR